MPHRISKITNSLKQFGEVQVTDLDFIDLMHKDISELEISRSLKKLGAIRVMEWDFRSVLPAINKLAQQEVDVAGLVRRTANYRIMDWEFRPTPPTESRTAPHQQAKTAENRLDPAEMQSLMLRLQNFLQYVVVQLIDEPNHARIDVQEIGPNVLRFKLVLVNRDVAMLIGRQGHTATAIRNILKSAAEMNGVHALLRILSHEEECVAPPLPEERPHKS